MKIQKCLGLPDLKNRKGNRNAKIIKCDRPVEDGEDWCKECGDEMMNRFRNNIQRFLKLDKR